MKRSMEDPTRTQSDPAPFRSPDVGRFAPGTLLADLSLWYAWQTFVAAAIVLGLSTWGFRNVLGRQTAFSGGVLDD